MSQACACASLFFCYPTRYRHPSSVSALSLAPELYGPTLIKRTILVPL